MDRRRRKEVCNGQVELSTILNVVFSMQFSNIGFRKAEPQKYRLLQTVDFICSMELLKIKRDEKRLNKSEEYFEFYYKVLTYLFDGKNVYIYKIAGRNNKNNVKNL